MADVKLKDERTGEIRSVPIPEGVDPKNLSRGLLEIMWSRHERRRIRKEIEAELGREPRPEYRKGSHRFSLR